MSVSHYFHYMQKDLEVEETRSFALSYTDGRSVLVTFSHPVYFRHDNWGRIIIYGTISQDIESVFREITSWSDIKYDLLITRLKEMMIVWGISSYKAD